MFHQLCKQHPVASCVCSCWKHHRQCDTNDLRTECSINELLNKEDIQELSFPTAQTIHKNNCEQQINKQLQTKESPTSNLRQQHQQNTVIG
jgi:hypothetical protein